MSTYEIEDKQVLDMPYKNHGPGGELPVISIGGSQAHVVCKPSNLGMTQSEPVSGSTNKTDIVKVKDWALALVPTSLLSAVVFYWQLTGQLAESTGFYALIALALIGGFKAGRCK